MIPANSQIVDEVGNIISRYCTDRQIAELLNALLTVNDDEGLSDDQNDIGSRLFERLTFLRPECVNSAATMNDAAKF